jgi:biotin transport system substrate-specific component
VVGFVAAGLVAGMAYERPERPVRIAGLAIAGLVIYAFGAVWLAASTGMSLMAAVAVGVLPFLLGDAIKTTVAYLLGVRLEAS